MSASSNTDGRRAQPQVHLEVGGRRTSATSVPRDGPRDGDHLRRRVLDSARPVSRSPHTTLRDAGREELVRQLGQQHSARAGVVSLGEARSCCRPGPGRSSRSPSQRVVPRVTCATAIGSGTTVWFSVLPCPSSRTRRPAKKRNSSRWAAAPHRSSRRLPVFSPRPARSRPGPPARSADRSNVVLGVVAQAKAFSAARCGRTSSAPLGLRGKLLQRGRRRPRPRGGVDEAVDGAQRGHAGEAAAIIAARKPRQRIRCDFL